MSAVGRALDILRRGGVVAIPTETVYGLAADADNPAGVARVFAIKGRPRDHPLIVHVASAGSLDAWGRTTPAALTLAEACWPGPLTMILQRTPRVIDAVTGGRDTVGLRVPAHPLTAELLAEFGGGLAAPSANRFGAVSPTTAAHVVADLDDDVDFVLDGGPCAVGVESTIVDCTVDPAQILRSGAITAEQVTALLGSVGDTAGPARAPGMLASHYAPRATVLLASTPGEADAMAAGLDHAAVIDGTDDLPRYARHLYAWLRAADDSGAQVIVAVLPPPAGLGHALRDRLTKAATPPGPPTVRPAP